MAENLLTPEILSRQTYLAPQKREEIKTSIQSLEWALRGMSMFGGMDMPKDMHFPGMDPAEPEILRESLEKDQALLSASTPPALSNPEKNKLYRRLKDLDDTIKHDMPTYDMMEVPTMSNVEHHMAWERLHKKHILERRNILRILDSENDSPFFTSVEQLRTSTPPKGDPRRFFQSFDYIQFQETKEEELSTVDDESYGNFLELKCAGWTDATICKQLNWPKETYNAAMARWRKAITDGSYTKFLELQAAGRPSSEIRQTLGWSQDLYEDAHARWRESVGTPPQASHDEPVDAPSVSYTVEDPEDAKELDAPWFAPESSKKVAKEASAKIAEKLGLRMKMLDIPLAEMAKKLHLHHLTLGRKLAGKSILSTQDIKDINAICDQIERERGYTSPDDIPLGGDPVDAESDLQGVT